MTATVPPPVEMVEAKTPFASGPSKIRNQRKFLLFTVLPITILCLLWLLPTFGLFVSSFRTEEDVNTSGWWTVFTSPFDFGQWTLENYRQVLDAGGMGTAFLNSFVVTIPSTVIPIIAASFAAYAFAWMKFPGRFTFLALLIALLVVPNYVAFIPILSLYGDIGISGEFAAVWLAHTGFGMSLSVYLLFNYMATLPRSIVESARLDGATHWQTFWKLILPLCTPVLAANFILQFLWVWNDFLVALIFLGSAQEDQVIQQALARLVGDRGQEWHLLTAGGFVAMFVPLVVFFSLQRFFVRGMTAGAVKG